jgi:hypothetical protein
VAYPGERVQIDMMVRGLAAACERFRHAAELQAPEPAYFALFECLNWAVALDELVGEIWRPEGRREGWDWRKRVEGADVLIGVRLVRNLVHHRWALALKFDPLKAGRDGFGPQRPPCRCR